METFDLFVENEWRQPRRKEYFETENPYLRKVWARVARATMDDVNEVVEAADEAFRRGEWPKYSGTQRGAVLRRLGELVDENAEDLARSESIDNGKTITEMRRQMENMAQWFYYYGGMADKLEGQTIPSDMPGLLNYTVYEPMGVVVAITPWNSPLRLMAWKMAPALAAGNTLIVKPSEFTSTSTLKFMELVRSANIPPGVINVITGFGDEVGNALVTHPLVKRIAFTGSDTVGIKINEAAASDLKKVSLELGGKSANIVFPDANMTSAVRGAVSAIFASAGQSCIAGSRLLVHEEMLEEFVEKVVSVTKRLRMGDPLSEETDLGPIATSVQMDKALRYVGIACEEGAFLRLGGCKAEQPECREGLFMEPTIFTNVNNGMRIAREEVFGPVLGVIPFSDEQEAIEIANDTAYGLAGAVWTQDLNRAHRVAHQVHAGSIWVNTYRVNSQLSPFGGYGLSGVGREGGQQAIFDYCQLKSIWLNLNEPYVSPLKSVNGFSW